jgi:hypothetical protein
VDELVHYRHTSVPGTETRPKQGSSGSTTSRSRSPTSRAPSTSTASCSSSACGPHAGSSLRRHRRSVPGPDAGPLAAADETRHFGLVAEDEEARAALADAGATILPGRRLDFLDPDGTRAEIVQDDQIQFTKPAGILRGKGPGLGKTDAVLAEPREQGLA